MLHKNSVIRLSVRTELNENEDLRFWVDHKIGALRYIHSIMIRYLKLSAELEILD